MTRRKRAWRTAAKEAALLRHLLIPAGLLVLLGIPLAAAAPATLHADHPLSSTLWDTRSGRQVSEQQMIA